MNIFIKRYGWIAVFGLLFLGILVYILCKEKFDISQLRFVDDVRGMEIKLYYDEKDDVYYLFLPAYVDMKRMTVIKPDDLSVDFATSGKVYDSNFSELPIDVPITLTIAMKKYHTKKYNVRILQGKNLKTLFIETGEGGMEKVHLNKNIKTPASVVVVDSDGNVVFNGLGSISGRGNATWRVAKKPYNIKFSQPVYLMGGERKGFQNWCLLANYLDDSQIRNALCYHIADKVGIKYTSDIDFVSLYINGEYRGLYNLATKQNYLTDADDILAVFEMNDHTVNDRLYDDKSDHYFYFRTRYGETENIRSSINSFENVLYSDNVTYRKLENCANLHSLVKKYFVDAVCSIHDISHSQYYMLDEDSVISAICAWDYDTSWGNRWAKFFSFSFNEIAVVHPWYNALFGFKEFRQELLKLLERNVDLLNYSTDEYTRNVCDFIRDDWDMNSIRWRNYYNTVSNVIPIDKYLNLSTLEDLKYIRSLYEKRIDFLREYWSSPERFCKITFVSPTSTSSKNMDRVIYCHINDSLTSNVLPDDIYYDSKGNEITWYSDDGISIKDVGIITHDMTFREKTLSKNIGWKDKIHKYLLPISVFPIFMFFIGLLVFKTIIIPIKESRR